jgi:RecB family endonuclease NucS
VRYQERDLDAARGAGMFVATRIKPQARVFATSRGIDCVEVALDDLREHDAPRLKLF